MPRTVHDPRLSGRSQDRRSRSRARGVVALLACATGALALQGRAATARSSVRELERGNSGASAGASATEGQDRGVRGDARAWQLTFLLDHPSHVGLLRARWGESSTRGVPIAFRWDVLRPAEGSPSCAAARDDGVWAPLPETEQTHPLWDESLAQPTRRSWFVGADACGLRLSVLRTNAGSPVVQRVEAIESATDALSEGRASDEGGARGARPDAAFDGAYATMWSGAPHRDRWALRVDLHEPERIDRVRLVFGGRATSIPRPGGGASYGVAFAPLRYTLEVSADGRHFAPLASEPRRPSGAPVPLRRRLVTLDEPRTVRALRLVVTSASGAGGLPTPDAAPVVREIAAFRAGDPRPVLAPPWVLSVNANPSGQTRAWPGGEVANDALHARFLRSRLGDLLPAQDRDDRVESIEGDDPELDEALVGGSSPPPIVVLGGSNDWDYAADTGPDPATPSRWHWDPLADASRGGMGQLAPAVQDRAAPFVGFCGGAQILALLEASRDLSLPDDPLETIDHVLQRTTGRPIRGFAPAVDVDRAWPSDPSPRRAEIRFAPASDLFADLAGPERRSVTRAFPEWHTDAIRPDAFGPGAPLERMQVIAESAFCAADGTGECSTIPEAFRSRDRGWPVIGAQFHAEQRDFASAAPGDPPESVADPRLFLAAVVEDAIDAYRAFGR